MSYQDITPRITPANAAGRPEVVIIGGGVSGAAVAWHLARASGAEGPRITLIEPRAELGRGLAYSTEDPDHRLNVPHLRMTLDTSDPDHYARWLASHDAGQLSGESLADCGAVYTPRAVFGAYVSAYLQPFLDAGKIRHLRGKAVAASRGATGWQIRLEDGARLRADRLVLAATHPAPGLPAGYGALQGHAALVPDAYASGALDGIDQGSEVMILGAGLTAADIVASLSRRGHRGPIHLVSRSGRRSQPHGPAQPETGADFTQNPATTARGLLRRIRAELARDAAKGLTWHPIFDRLRKQGPQVWAQLPAVERARLLRHLRGLWDVHRFRIAPQTLATVAAAEASGQLQAHAGRVQDLTTGPEGITLTLRLRRGGTARITPERVILATGPAHGGVTRSNPLYADLAAQGLIAIDALRLGLAATPEGLAEDAQGLAQPDLFIAGPLARAAVGELMGVPEVIAWSEKIALHLARQFA